MAPLEIIAFLSKTYYSSCLANFMKIKFDAGIRIFQAKPSISRHRHCHL